LSSNSEFCLEISSLVIKMSWHRLKNGYSGMMRKHKWIISTLFKVCCKKCAFKFGKPCTWDLFETIKWNF
jgi:hypothetical protein